MQDRFEALQAIYDEEHAAAIQLDPNVVPRVPVPEVLESDLFLVGQALGRDTQRLSGYPYVFPGGPPHRLSNGGQVLDRWLSDCGYTIHPGEETRRYAYHADLHPGFPGRNERGGDVVPTADQIAAGARWLAAEITTIDPTVVVCLGKEPALEILGRYAGVRRRLLKDVVCRRWEIEVEGRALTAYAAYHPSGAWQYPEASERAWEFIANDCA